MERPLNPFVDEQQADVYRFYLLIFGLLVSFIVAETLIEEFVLGFRLTLFQHMIPSALLYGVMLLVTFWWAGKTDVSTEQMGFHADYLAKSVAIGLLATSGYLVAVLAFQIPPSTVLIHEIVLLLGFTFLIGLTEESVFRGYIQTKYHESLSQFKAVLLTGILFALLHIPSYIISGAFANLIGIPSLILVGLILGFIRVRTGNIWGVIIAHATWDFYLFLFTPEISMEASIAELIPALVASGAMWGTILLAMIVAGRWIDRPTQIPGELAHEFELKITSLVSHIMRLGGIVSGGVQGFVESYAVGRYAEKIRMEEEFLQVYKKYLPFISQDTYKLIKELVPRKLKVIKLKMYLARGGPPQRLQQLEDRKMLLENEIQALEYQLDPNKVYNG
jgi:membrane protease YdiL (CAAX protease family)